MTMIVFQISVSPKSSEADCTDCVGGGSSQAQQSSGASDAIQKLHSVTESIGAGCVGYVLYHLLCKKS